MPVHSEGSMKRSATAACTWPPATAPTPVGVEPVYPGRAGGLWLRMIFPAGLVTWLVPSG
jgi:hypothetical protein